MKIDIYATAQTTGQKDDRRTACALILAVTAPDGRVLMRRMHFALGNSTINLAGLQAVRLGLMALRPWVGGRRIPVALHTDSHYAIDMLTKEDGQYKADPRSNVDVVASIRQLHDRHSGLVLTHQKFDTGIGNECLSLARSAAVSQANSDGGTKEFANAREAGLSEAA